MPGKGKPFVKGHKKAGPGRPTHSEEIKKASSLTMAEARAKLSEFLKLPFAELQDIIKDLSRPCMDLWIARIVLLGIKNGDQVRLNFMFDRLIGKVTDKVEHTLPRPTIIQLSDTEQIVLGCEKQPE